MVSWTSLIHDGVRINLSRRSVVSPRWVQYHRMRGEPDRRAELGRLLTWIRRIRSNYTMLIRVSIVTTLSHLGYGVLNQSAITPYAIDLGWTAYLGAISAAFVIAETIGKTPAGTVIDRIGVRPVYTTAALVGAVSAVLWTVVHNLPTILVVRVIDGGASAGAWTGTVVATSSSVDKAHRPTAMAVFTLTYLAGIALGPLIGGYANDSTHSTATSFYVTSGLFLVAAAASQFLLPRVMREEDAETQEPRRSKSLLASVWFGLKAVPDYMFIAFMTFFAIGLLVPIMKAFALQQLRMSEESYGLIALPVALILAGASLASGTLTKAWGRARSVHVGLAVSAASMYAVPLIHYRFDFGVLATLIGLGFAIGMPAWLALISDISAPNVRGAVLGAVGTGQGVGVIIGNLLGGYLYTDVPFRFPGVHLNSHYSPFMWSAVSLTIAFVLSLIFIRKGTGRYVTEET